MKNFIKTTLIGGVLYLVPLILVVIVAAKALGLITKIVRPIVESRELHSTLGINIERLVAIFVLVAICFTAGLFARTRVAGRFMGWLESSVLSILPGYSLFASLTGEVAGAHKGATPEVVLASIEDAWQIALLVERIDENTASVYVPGSPSPNSGSVYFMSMDRLRSVNKSFAEASKCIKGMGFGAREFLAGQALQAAR